MPEIKSTIGTVASAATLIASGAVILAATRTVFNGITKKHGGNIIAMGVITLLVGVAAFRYSMNELKTKE